MPLTEDQKAGVRRYLGYPDVNRILYQSLEGAMVALSESGVAQVGAVLQDLEAIEEHLRGSWSRQKVHRAEDVVLAGHDELAGLRSEGNRLVDQLASILGVSVRSYPFTTGGAVGVAGRG